MAIWNQRYETMSRDELQQVQLERLQAILNRAYENVAYYKRLFDQSGTNPEDIRSLDDLSGLPFTTRDDLRNGYPYDAFAVPLRDVVRVHASGGVAGAPIVSGHTVNDLHNWSELAARILSAGDVGKEDVVQVFFGYGMFSAGFGFQYGAEKIGASVVPASLDNPESRIAVMRDFRITALVGTPAYALSLVEQIQDAGINPRALSLRTGVFGGEPWSEKLRSRIEESLGITALDCYGPAELSAPGVSWECGCRCGMHIAEDHFIAEVVDPDTGKPVEPGVEGELVLTTLMKEALPLIRYRTGDLTTISPEPCECGRTLARMSRVHARTDDMITVQGIGIFPSQIDAILEEVEGTKPHYRLVIYRQGLVDELEIQVEVSDNIFTDMVGKLVRIEERIMSRVRSTLGITPRVKFVEPRSLDRSAGRRVIVDMRE